MHYIYYIYFLTIILCILNTIFLYKVIKRKKILSMNLYTIINLSSSNYKSMNKLIVPFLIFNYILILSYIIINKFIIIFYPIYFPMLFFSEPIIYINNYYVGTLVRGIDTKDVEFIEINIHVEYIETVFKCKNDVYKKFKYKLSIFKKNKDVEINKFIDTLKEYGYTVYVRTFN